MFMQKDHGASEGGVVKSKPEQEASRPQGEDSLSDRERQAIEELDRDFIGDEEYAALSLEEKRQLLRVMEKMLKMGIGAVYGDESDDEPDAEIPCERHMDACRAACCTYHFALTREEAKSGYFQHDCRRPFFLAKRPLVEGEPTVNGRTYCVHLDLETYQCQVWAERPLRCRRYGCDQDREVWPEGYPG